MYGDGGVVLPKFAVEFLPKGAEIDDVLTRRANRRRTLKAIPRLIATRPTIKLEIGAGARPGTGGWVTMDTEPDSDLYWDLRHGIPFPDSSVGDVYSSHLFEHLSYRDGLALMREGLRILAPGGRFSLAVPNARIYIEGYLGGRVWEDPFFGWRPAHYGTTAIDAVNYVAYMDGQHRHMFDEDNLVYMLSAAGFADVQLRDFDESVDSPLRDFESIYAIGTKPQT